MRVLMERCDHPAYNGVVKNESYPPESFIAVGDLLQLLFARDLLEDYRAVKRLSVHHRMGFDQNDADTVHKAVERAIDQQLDYGRPFGPDTMLFKWI